MCETISVVIVPNKLRYINFIQKYLHRHTILIQYRYDSGFNGIIEVISNTIGSRKVRNMAIVLYSTPFGVYICSNDGRVQRFSFDVLIAPLSLQTDFFKNLSFLFDREKEGKCRMDILSCSLASTTEIENIQTFMSEIIKIQCNISKDLWGNDIIMGKNDNNLKTAADFYFSNTTLSSFSPQQTMNNFEKIRTVGKGAFGTAVLYRKKDDDSLVILKEINMHDLTAVERQMAMNEVKVLSLLDHPNIVAYYDSFEEDGILIIEMEYADNGTLCQFLSKRENPLEEKEILDLFQQIVAAIHYIHERKILHRDLKTANIFLTKEGIVKIGDFGISKMLTTSRTTANSVIGTPHYISPEMCQGKIYNEKSDVWSLGCILYEMTCLHKTFEGSNLPAIVNKIVKGQFEPVKGNYSDEIKELISSMLQKNPDERYSTDIILYHKLPMMLKKFEQKRNDDSGLRRRNTRSVLYTMDIQTLSLVPVSLPSRIRIKQVCSSKNHVIVLTTERLVYTWGNNKYGQLGHGDIKDRSNPELVSNLSQKSLIRVSCGSDFSIFGSENGIIMTCGYGSNGCLGHGDFRDVWKPKLIEILLSVDIICVNTTFEHVIVVTSENSVYGWGSNKNGQLGLSNNTLYSSPQKINISEPVIIQNAFTSEDATILLTDAGALLASGSNYGNKLGLNARLGFLMTMKSISQQPCVSGVTEFVPVRNLSRHRINQVSMGRFHTVVICQSGKVISFGVNIDGQLGNGHTKNAPITSDVKGFRKHTVTKISSGQNYSVAYVNYNSLYFWGKRRLKRENFSSEISLNEEDGSNDKYTSYIDKVETPRSGNKVEASSSEDVDESLNVVYKTYSLPVLILHLKNSKVNDPDKELICLTDCITYGESDLLVHIETTAPPPKRGKRRSKTVNNLKRLDSVAVQSQTIISENQNTQTLINQTSKTFESDSMPTWIKNELLEALEENNDKTLEVEKSSVSSLHQMNFLSNRSKPISGDLCRSSIRIYSSSDQNCCYSDFTNSSSNSINSNSLPINSTKRLSFRRNKSEQDFFTQETVSKDQELEKQLNSLQIQLQTQQLVIAKSTDLVNQLKNKIDRLHLERQGDKGISGKHISTVCLLQ